MLHFGNYLAFHCLFWVAFVLSANYLGADHEPGDLPRQPHWPKGSYELVNQAFRVHGYWVNFYDEFFYKGGNPEMEKMVNGLSRLENVEMKVVLHAGNGQAKSPWSKAPVCPADWAVSFSGPIPKEIAELENVPFSKAHQVTVDIWTGGHIDLGQLKLPAKLELQSGNEIEDFIRQHKMKSQQKRQAVVEGKQ